MTRATRPLRSRLRAGLLLVVATATAAAGITVAPATTASATGPVGYYTAVAAPPLVAAGSSSSYAVRVRNVSLLPVTSVRIAVPAGFTVTALGPALAGDDAWTLSNQTCTPSTPPPCTGAGGTYLQADAPTHGQLPDPLWPLMSVVVSFQASAAVTAGTYTWGTAVATIPGIDWLNLALLGPAPTTTVYANAAASLVVSGLPTGPVTAGTALTPTVTAVDSHGNLASGYRGTVHFALSPAGLVALAAPAAATPTGTTLPGDYTFTPGDAGRHTFTGLTLTGAPAQGFAVTDLADASVTGSATVAITPGPASSLKLTAPPTATAGSSFPVAVTAFDQYGNTATGYTGTVHFTSDDNQTGTQLPGDYAIASATRSSAGGSAPSTISRWCRQTRGSCTRSTSSISPASYVRRTSTASPRRIPTRWSGPTRIRRWSTALVSSAGAWGASKPRRRCWASRARCSSRKWSDSVSTGAMPKGATATDLVLTITEILRKHGVVGKFVEFFGDGLGALTIADRATLGNMCPEYGATVAIFPIDHMTLDYLRLTGREESQVALVEQYAMAQGLFRTPGSPDAIYSEVIELHLGSIEPSLAGPKRPQDRVSLANAKAAFQAALPSMQMPAKGSGGTAAACAVGGRARRAGRGHARSRRGRHRRDHELHEHVESERHDWRGTGREEGRGARADAPAVGEEQPRTRLEGRHRVSRRRGLDPLPRSARVQSRRLRLHDVHRKQRSITRGRRRDRAREEPGRLLGAERQPQLRGTHSAGRPRQLPRVAAARRRLRAGRLDHDRHHDRTARPRSVGAPGVSERHLADRARAAGDDAEGGDGGHVPSQLRGRVQRRCALAGPGGSRGQSLRVGQRLDLRAQADLPRGHDHGGGAAAGHRRCARAGRARRQRDDRPHLAGRLDQGGQPGRKVPDREGREAGRLQLVRSAPRQSRGDDARHVRQHSTAETRWRLAPKAGGRSISPAAS